MNLLMINQQKYTKNVFRFVNESGKKRNHLPPQQVMEICSVALA